jgi:hypothetical protein
MSIKVPDLSGTESVGGFDPLPPGWYSIRVDGAQETKSRSETPGVELTMCVEDPREHANRLLWDTIWITQASLGFVKQKLEAMGYPIPQGGFDLDPNSLVGRRCRVRVDHETYEGKTRVKVKGYGAPDGGSFPSTPGADDWRTMVQAGQDAKGADDIPFIYSRV